MQNVVRGSLGNSGKERLLLEEEKSAGSGSSSSPLRTPSNNLDNKCQAYADLQDKFFTVSGESDSEDGEESEVSCSQRHVEKKEKSQSGSYNFKSPIFFSIFVEIGYYSILCTLRPLYRLCSGVEGGRVGKAWSVCEGSEKRDRR